jgi:hypothetical protein
VADLPLPSFALQVMVELPADFAVIKPLLLTEATLVLLDVHETLLSVALLGDTVAVSCLVAPSFNDMELEFNDILVTFTS